MIRKRSITLHGHRTSFSVEDAFLIELQQIAATRGTSFAALIAEVDENRPTGANLSSALRLYVLNHLKTLVATNPAPETAAEKHGQPEHVGRE